MNYENYIELYEAVYLFNKINGCEVQKFSQPLNKAEILGFGINESIYKAILRILVVNNLLEFNGQNFVLTDENMEALQDILETIINKDPYKQYTAFYNKAVDASQYFFDNISEDEYDIYSRCDFEVTFEIGKIVAKYLNLSNRKVLELGGNSGSFGTALIKKYADCDYTIIDTQIPCKVGNAYKKVNDVDINFIEGDIFDLELSNDANDTNDCIVLMNMLHDFDDLKCLKILQLYKV